MELTSQFAPVVCQLPKSALQSEPPDLRLRWWGDGRLDMYYAPFDYINLEARVAIVGITPAASQMCPALMEFRHALDGGYPVSEALKRAKYAGSFHGMRTDIAKMLDSIGFHKVLGTPSCSELFHSRNDLTHFTSALRYPTFLDGGNYNGKGIGILKHRKLRSVVDCFLTAEVNALRNAIWVPLGPVVSEVFDYVVGQRTINAEQVLSGLPHPSGANRERVAYFLGQKDRSDLSIKTNAAKIDDAREQLTAKIARLKGLMR